MRGRPPKFDPDKASRDALVAMKTNYDQFLTNIKKGIDSEATGSDRLNEMKAIIYATEQLPELIRRINSMQKMIVEKDYDTSKDVRVGDSENLMDR